METTMDDVTVESENNSEHNGDNPQEIEFEVETCRLCDELGEKMYNIFDENPEGYQLIGLIKENLPIVLYKSDPLSKQVCEKCVEGLQIISSLRKRSRNTQEKYVEKLKNEADTHDKNVLLFLGCTGSKLMNNGDNEDDEDDEELKDECTSTDDLTILCANCKTAILDASTVNGEVELAADLHKIIAESLRKNKVMTADIETEKVLRKRKIQPIYQELDDSLCSSLTDLTRRTAGDDESSQFATDMDSEDSTEERPSKRKKFENETKKIQEEINEALAKRKELPAEEDGDVVETTVDPLDALEPEKVIDYVEMFEQEPDFTFEPLSLLQISLNVINSQNIEDYSALSYVRKSTVCKCNTCGEEFKNMKLLALHEFHHMDVEMEEKIDNPMPWPEDHPYANVRNKWLTYFDENGYDEDDIVINDDLSLNREEVSLLVEKSEKTLDVSNKDEVVLVNMKPMVNGVYLGDYTKEERKMFYQCMRIGGQTKRFCPLCRYCFKDNWAIESHYFSSACHYTCRYCGMRFNKQRHRFDEHVQKHKEKNDPISDKIFTASKINNTMPKIIQPNKVRRIVQVDPEQPREIKLEEYMTPQMRNQDGRLRQMGGQYATTGVPNSSFVKIKEEPRDYGNPQNKNQNQAYFCRKCYKVFFKLDEFNAHSKSCDYNQFHTAPAAPYRNAPETTASPTPRGYQNNSPRTVQNERRSNGGEYSSTGRPVRNCAKDIGPYTDEVYIPKQFLNETVANPSQGFICHICGTPFPTIYSRNSHMRIHKGEMGGPGSNMIMSQPPQNNILKQRLQQQQHMQRVSMHQKNMYQNPSKQNNYPQFEEIKIKQEPVDSFEPMVEIHEGHEEPPSPPQRYNAGVPPRELGGGAVSITPINKNGGGSKQNLSPNIMKLVQNNPNISISKRPTDNKPQRHSTGNLGRGGGSYNGNSSFQGAAYPAYTNPPPASVDDRSYKCSSCWEAFSNKSHLYFHKKNQCEGSRFPCPFCKKRFGTEAAYSSHIFYSHPE